MNFTQADIDLIKSRLQLDGYGAHADGTLYRVPEQQIAATARVDMKDLSEFAQGYVRSSMTVPCYADTPIIFRYLDDEEGRTVNVHADLHDSLNYDPAKTFADNKPIRDTFTMELGLRSLWQTIDEKATQPDLSSAMMYDCKTHTIYRNDGSKEAGDRFAEGYSAPLFDVMENLTNNRIVDYVVNRYYSEPGKNFCEIGMHEGMPGKSEIDRVASSIPKRYWDAFETYYVTNNMDAGFGNCLADRPAYQRIREVVNERKIDRMAMADDLVSNVDMSNDYDFSK